MFPRPFWTLRTLRNDVLRFLYVFRSVYGRKTKKKPKNEKLKPAGKDQVFTPEAPARQYISEYVYMIGVSTIIIHKRICIRVRE